MPLVLRSNYHRTILLAPCVQTQSHRSPLTPRTPESSPNFVTSYPEPPFPPHFGQARPVRIDPISPSKEFNPRTCSRRWRSPDKPPQHATLAPTAISSHPSISSFSSPLYPIPSHQSLLSTLHFPTLIPPSYSFHLYSPFDSLLYSLLRPPSVPAREVVIPRTPTMTTSKVTVTMVTIMSAQEVGGPVLEEVL